MWYALHSAIHAPLAHAIGFARILPRNAFLNKKQSTILCTPGAVVRRAVSRVPPEQPLSRPPPERPLSRAPPEQPLSRAPPEWPLSSSVAWHADRLRPLPLVLAAVLCEVVLRSLREVFQASYLTTP